MHPRIVTVAVGVVVALTSVAGFQLWRGSAEPLEGVSRSDLESLRAQLARVERSVARSTGAGGPESAPAADLKELRIELRAMREELGRLARRLSEQTPARDAESSPSPARPRDALGAHLDRVLDGEAPSADANRLSDVLRPAILDVLPQGASLHELVCRSSLCRMEIAYPDLASYQGFLEGQLWGAKGALWNGPIFQELRTDPRSGDDVIGVVYLAREASVLQAAR